jgi:hypothetical protein
VFTRPRVGPRIECGAQDGGVVERSYDTGRLLTLLVPLAQNQHHVS